MPPSSTKSRVESKTINDGLQLTVVLARSELEALPQDLLERTAAVVSELGTWLVTHPTREAR